LGEVIKLQGLFYIQQDTHQKSDNIPEDHC